MKNKKAYNVLEAKELVKKYRSITKKKIFFARIFSRFTGSHFDGISRALNFLTGWGTSETCTLCQAVDDGCNETPYYCELCIHGDGVNRMASDAVCINHETYVKLSRANTPQELIEAVKNRANYLETLL